MTTILFVKANNYSVGQEVSVKLYEAFLSSYKKSHPNDTVVELDLYNEELPYIGGGTIKASKGLDLTAEEKKAVTVSDKYFNQFLAADKVIFGFPSWNFTIPAVLQTYIDYLYRSGKTFQYTSDGSVALIKDKKVALLNTRGSVYSVGPIADVEMAVKYLSTMMSLLGVTNMETIVIEGYSHFPDKAEEIIAEGLEKAVKVASIF
ncbi:FMN-dependent NADH-azoreductase [Bacillus thuringiensis serovar yunnanensis]|nr:FMN-dependent NADH-azoreductase [Bacillus thuringiensis serovar yunnanensis]